MSKNVSLTDRYVRLDTVGQVPAAPTGVAGRGDDDIIDDIRAGQEYVPTGEK